MSGNVYCTKTHDSLRISNGKWCWFSAGSAVYSALDYLIKVNGYSFLEAMENHLRQGGYPAAFLCPCAERGKAQTPASAPGRPG